MALEREGNGIVSIETRELVSRADVVISITQIAGGLEAGELLGIHEIVEGRGLRNSDGINVRNVDVLGGQIKVSSEGLGVTLELRFRLNLDSVDGNSPGVGVNSGNNQISA